MGVHGRTFVGKTSTRSPTNSNKSKKPVTEINSQLKSSLPKSSTSTVAGTRPDASTSVDANMAPALTEPLSPTEKLSSAVVSVTPTSISSKKEGGGDSPLESSASPSSSTSRGSPSTNTILREKRSSLRNVPISTRVTRSKDSPVAVRISPITSSTRKLKLDTNNDDANDPMGLSAVTPSTTSKSTFNQKQSPVAVTSTNLSANNNNNTIPCKDTATEQLLADLTTDFEETITAEICLRKKLPEVKVSTPDAAQLSASQAEADISIIKPGSSDITEISESKSSPAHMESVSTNISAEEDSQSKEIKSKPSSSSENDVTASISVVQPKSSDTKESAPINAILSEPPATQTSTTGAPDAGVRIISVEDLPPINSDSTMTASEEETEELDALEARLSQLDSVTTITPTSNNDNVSDAAAFVTTTSSNAVITATSPSTPSQLQLTPTAVTISSSSTQQLLLTPTSGSSQTLALTPQSTSSLLREIGATTVSGEVEDQEFEEVLKALKGFDANSATADTVLDLNILFNEVYTSLNCEDIGNNQQQSQQQNLLPLMATPNANTKAAGSPLKDLHGEIEKKQQTMQRKIEFIMRRLRKLQVRYMSKHTTEEIAGLFELAARVTNKSSSPAHSSGDTNSKSVISARPPVHFWEEDIKQPVPTSQVINLLQRIETSANIQQLCTTTSNNENIPSYSAPTISSTQQLKKSKKVVETINSSVTAPEVDVQKSNEVVPTFTPQVVDELTHVAGMLKAEMRDVQTAYDSDATESSSGGESADEMVSYNNQVQQSLSIVKRAAWRYSRERAAIASRWSWLLSQIADLEIKIRQHSELYQEVVRTKGAVVCEEELAKTSTSASRLTVNAYGETEENALPGAARTRGYVPSQFRKRKLLQTTNLHTISKKAARPSTIKCGCQWPLNPCALCTGRIDPTAPRDLPDTMMLPERVALLDPGYHPVLSFNEDVNNSIHIEAIARSSSWQQRIVRIQPKTVARSIWKAEREAANSSYHNASRKFGDVLLPTQKRRYIRRKERNVTSASSTITTATASASGGTGGGSNNSSNVEGSLSTLIHPKPQSMSTTPTLNMKNEPATVGNGTANLFTSTTTSTTPLGANTVTASKQMAQSSKKMYCHMVGDGVLLEQHSSSNSTQRNDCQKIQNFDPYNPNPAHSSLISNQHQHNISNRKGKFRKSAALVSMQNQNSNNNYSNHNFQHNHNNNSHIQQTFTNGDINSDYWDSVGRRSRTASPTHGIGSSSNYHKYERSLERRNRISYDIDNIVIPYSVAATTRVEILPYKEIPTPKWRVFDEMEVGCEESTEQNAGESLQTIKNITEIEVAQKDASIKECSISETDTKLEQDSIVHTNSKDSLQTDNDVEVKIIQKKNEITSEDTVKTLSKESIASEEYTQCAVNAISAQAVSSKVDVENCVKSDNASLLENSDEPPAKKIKVSTKNIESINVMPFLSKESSGKMTVAIAEENDNQEKEQILFTDLEEDISDDAFALRHERALNEERRKFQTYLKFPWSTRSRANRRIDSRAESSGANTPDPASPAPNTPSIGGGDQESIPSPLAPSTPLTPLETMNDGSDSVTTNNASLAHSSTAIVPPAFPITAANIPSKRKERRRTTSTKILHLERNERRSLTPDSREVAYTVPPYEPLKFPLSDDTFEMLSSVTLLPPSVSNFFADDYNSKDDHYNTTGAGVSGSNYFKSGTSARSSRRSSVRNEYTLQRSVSKTSAINYNCDPKAKRRKSNNKRNSLVDMAHQVAESSDATKYLPYINGQSKSMVSESAATGTNNSTDIDDYAEDLDDTDYFNEMMEDDDEDDGYQKHPLAPGIDIDNFDDDEYNAYMGEGNSNSLLDGSDTESEVDPFQDDDPNDPEWKGESKSERPERFRKRS